MTRECDFAVSIGFFAAEIDRPLSVVIDYITGHKDAFGVEPICRTLKEAGIKIASSTYYARIAHPPAEREMRDRILMDYLQRLFTQNFLPLRGTQAGSSPGKWCIWLSNMWLVSGRVLGAVTETGLGKY